MQFVISSAVGNERIPTFAASKPALGRAHYSWKIIASMYRRGLEAIGYDVAELIAGDIYQADRAREVVGIRDRDIGFIVKPIEFIRPCFGLKNIAVCGWEFPEFSTISRGGDPRTNQIGMLGAVDDVWCWSEFTANNLVKFGVNARCLPPPVSVFTGDKRESLDDVPCVRLDSRDGFDPTTLMSATERFGDIRNSFTAGHTFLSVLNPWDKRKCIGTLLKAAVSTLQPKNKLVVKLIIDNEGTRVDNINAILKIHYNLEIKSPDIIFIGQQLSDEQMHELYNVSDYYLSASSAEGLNLPLIEAMSQGLVAISTDKTAMSSYVSNETAIVIPAERESTGPGFHSASAYLETSHFPPSVEGVQDSIRRAQRMTSAGKDRLVRNARRKIKSRYGLARFAKDVGSAL